MGWGRTLLLGDIGNRLDIEDVEQDVARLKHELAHSQRKGNSHDLRYDALIRENGELKLYLAAVVRLLTAKGVITKTELETLVDAIDAEDGRSDGKYDGPLA